MLGLMQDRPLTLPHIFHRAEQLFGHKTLVTARPDGTERTVTVAEWAVRVRRLATALDTLGISDGGRVGTFCWNTSRHLELYLAAPCTGRVLHTLNIRLHPDQLVYVADHAGDEVVFVDRSLLGLLWPHVDRLPGVRHVVVLDDGADTPVPDDPRIRDYEELLAAAAPYEGRFEVEDENAAAAMCYTSGTTGNPKGVVYSHRSTMLHSMVTLIADGPALAERDVVMPVVPMFHANCWGLPYGCLLAGTAMVFPGPDLSPGSLLDLIERHRVTVTGGVPTIWMNALPLLAEHDLASLRMIICGGSAVPKALSEEYRRTLGLPLTHLWGMTETSPIGTVGMLGTHLDGASEEELAAARVRQGRPVPLVEMRIADPDTGEEMPWDDRATGEVQASGPWIAAGYHRGEGGGTQFTDDGWLRTGDVAAVDPYGSFRLVDRTKDLIKSGGEWIGTVELENEIMAHPRVAEAAVIGVPHEKWVERPLACVVVEPGSTLTAEELLEFLAPRVARWWLPDAVEFIDEVPKTSVGKFSKRTLRERFEGYALPT
ncbi:long-chain fatty acid--CoA ligase [Pseudonocardia sp. EC080610-09]|uniref:long-chain fatty acid--CoA ligase n=1 Tax=unclassified Pseudonocardia TaxID=2619320 RepID=UPI0006CB0A77|nr:MULTISPECIES: long-chain fatty acid--CoA ligase [unclassified Pseudonocardia]ALE72325.1 long-chain fatty acid--CoA ligase [Pseudonocardia sp. EC080625-04]ALL75615.1 long-chain fatty acid--CoA ligase [Pseudonocardia sp. EC080610-09]ALL82644.1 long-chain fatty acid--CoA ligase [Pseudonocardia sp. EC080619-01]